MTFEALNFTSYSGVIFGCLVVAVVLFVGIWMLFDYLDVPGFLFPPAVVVMLAIVSIFCVIASAPAAQETAQNNVKATNNLKVKYDIKDVLWEDSKTTAASNTRSPNEQIVLVANNDQRYVFDYVVDTKTSEPTITSLPIQGGATSDNATTAEALLKK